MASEHPWIEDIDNFEAVLICLDTDIPEWDTAAILRAFQTFQFNDARTAGSDPTFVHSETGVIVRFDGNTLGIECGHDELVATLSDIVLTLYELGWRNTELYCPDEYQTELLEDFGRSIPANRDFDIQPARLDQATASTAETTAFITHGRKALLEHGLTGSVDDILRSGFESLSDESTATTQVNSPSHSPITPGAFVIEDDNIGLDENVVLVANAPVNEDFTDPSTSDMTPLALPTLPTFDEQGTPMTFVIPQDAHAGAGFNVEVLDSAAVKPASPQDLTRSASASAILIETSEEHSYGQFIKIGQNVFVFIASESTLSDAELEKICAGEVGTHVESVIRIFPGAKNQLFRWDVLNEIDDSYPMFADGWARCGFGSEDAAEIAMAVMELKKRYPQASLRDLMLLGLSEAGSSQFSARKRMGRHLELLKIIPEGQAFIDCVPPDNQEVFTVKSLMDAPESRLFVVTTDSLDGPFTEWLVGFLKNIVLCYSRTQQKQKTSCSTKSPEVVQQEDVSEVVQNVVVSQTQGTPASNPEELALLITLMTKFGIKAAA